MNTGVKRHRISILRKITGVFHQNDPVIKTGGLIMVNVSKEGQVFRCDICGNVVVVKEAGGGELVCCGEPMILEEG